MSFDRRCGAASAARDAACDALLPRIRDERIETVRVAFADLHGAYRCKTLVGADALAAALHAGVGMAATVLLKDMSDRTAFSVFEPATLGPELAAFGNAGNLLLLPDPISLQLLPWCDEPTGWLRATPFHVDGSAVACDPRGVLQRALAALAAAGYTLRCGLEVEFHIYRITDERLAAEDAAWPHEPPALRLLHPGYKLLSESHADQADAALAIVRRTALALGLPLRSLEIELGPSQVEAVFAPTDALTTADQMLVLRNHVRQALRRAGYHASFVCQPPLPGAVASGWHLHQSLLQRGGPDEVRNAMARAHGSAAARADDARSLLSDTGAHWLGGLLAHARGMTALCAPTIPAYARYQSSPMAPRAALWGRDNRGAMLRVIADTNAADECSGDAPCGAATRIENRLGEPLANPYLMIAAQVFAGLDGLQRGLDPGPAATQPYAAPAAPLPASLAEALDALAADSVLQQGLGAAMALVFNRVKRQEIARHAAADDQALWERREYFGNY